jgi:hypothetical protein
MSRYAEIAEPFDLPLTPEYLLGLSPRVHPLVVGDDVDWRFQILDRLGRPFDLTGALLEWAAWRHEKDSDVALATPLLRRSSRTLVVAGLYQIEADADQTTETVDANGDPIGKGWCSMRWRGAADETVVLAAIGEARFHAMRVKFAGTVPKTVFKGQIRPVRSLIPNSVFA